jgi:hypothetical protein
VSAVSLSHVAIEQLDGVVDGAAGRAMMTYRERQQSSERKAEAEELERAASRLQIRLGVAGRAVLLFLSLGEAGLLDRQQQRLRDSQLRGELVPRVRGLGRFFLDRRQQRLVGLDHRAALE